MDIRRKHISRAVAFAGMVIVVSNNVNQFFGSLMNGDTTLILFTASVILGAFIDSDIMGGLR